jgi:hypothetical protein
MAWHVSGLESAPLPWFSGSTLTALQVFRKKADILLRGAASVLAPEE